MNHRTESINPLVPGAHPEILQPPSSPRHRQNDDYNRHDILGMANTGEADDYLEKMDAKKKKNQVMTRNEMIHADGPLEHIEDALPSTRHDGAIARVRQDEERLSKQYLRGGSSDERLSPSRNSRKNNNARSKGADSVTSHPTTVRPGAYHQPGINASRPSEDVITTPPQEQNIEDDGYTGDVVCSNAFIVDETVTTTHQHNNTGDDGPISEDDTIPPRVLWKKEQRRWTDWKWAVMFGICYVAFLSTGIFMIIGGKPKYQVTTTGESVISDNFLDDVTTCCNSIDNDRMDDLCYQIDTRRRRRQRGLDDTTTTTDTTTARLTGDGGLFEAFVMAPEIVVGLTSLAFFLAVIWIAGLQAFPKIVVFLTELVKIGILIVIGYFSGNSGMFITCLVVASGILAFDLWFRKSLVFAGRVISQSSQALRENNMMVLGLLGVVIFYVVNTGMFVLFLSKGYQIVTVESRSTCYDDGTQTNCQPTGCVFVTPPYIPVLYLVNCITYLWTVLLCHKIRLSIIAFVVGSWHFDKDTDDNRDNNAADIITMAVVNSITTSLGTLSVASLISTVADKVRRVLTEPFWQQWIGCVCVTLPLNFIIFIFGALVGNLLKVMTKFSVIVHVFTGRPFVGSGKTAYKIMSRHFKGGFVTEMTSRSVLHLGSYMFSICFLFLAWAWFDKKFQTNTLIDANSRNLVVAWLIFALFNLWYPLLGVYIIILLNGALRGSQSDAAAWVGPLGANFVGCIAMMYFCYVAEIIIDVVDVLFMCYAIDKDNKVDLSGTEMDSLVMAIPQAIVVAEPVQLDSDLENVSGRVWSNDGVELRQAQS